MKRDAIIEAKAVRDLLIVAAVSDVLRIFSAYYFALNFAISAGFIVAKLLLVAGLPFLLWKAGKVHSAAIAMIVGGMVIATAYLFVSGGLRSSGVVVLVSIPIMAAFLEGISGALLASSWSLINLLVFALLSPTPRLIETPTGIVINVLAGVSVCVVAWWRLCVYCASTEKERGEASERLSSLIDALEGIAWEWKDGRFTYVSGQAERLLGFSCDSWTSQPNFLQRRVHESDRLTSANFEDTDCEFRVYAQDGSELWIRNIPSPPMPDGTRRGLIIDITARKMAESNLMETENHLRGILDSAPECIKLLGPDTSILAMNKAGLRMVDAENFDDVGGKRASGIVTEPYRKGFCELHRRAFLGESGSMSYEIRGLLGSVRWLESTAVPLFDARGSIVASLSVTRDMTESRRMEESLRRSHAHLTQASRIAGLGYIFHDLVAGAPAEYSPEVYRMHGVPESAPESVLFDAISVEDRARTFEVIAKLHRAGTPFDVVNRITLPDGEPRMVQVRGWAELDSEGIPIRSFGVMQDVTVYHQTAQRLRELSEHLENIREQERANIAREIHDELGQQLTGLKMRVAFAEHLRRTGSATLAPELASMESDLEEAIRTVRRIATELRPPSLATHGLYAALEVLTQRFQSDHGIACEFTAEELFLSPATETAVFRVAQEALTNVAKHAGATFVSVRLSAPEGACVLEVEDNGSGLCRPPGSGKSFGLTNMQERARMHRGELELLAGQTGGLLVRLTIPLPMEPEPEGDKLDDAEFSYSG